MMMMMMMLMLASLLKLLVVFVLLTRSCLLLQTLILARNNLVASECGGLFKAICTMPSLLDVSFKYNSLMAEGAASLAQVKCVAWLLFVIGDIDWHHVCLDHRLLCWAVSWHCLFRTTSSQHMFIIIN
eukprot:2436590-Rhodomonas_salina.1